MIIERLGKNEGSSAHTQTVNHKSPGNISLVHSRNRQTCDDKIKTIGNIGTQSCGVF